MATETVLLERPAVVRATSADVPLEEGPNNSAPAQCDKPCEVRPGLFIGSSVTEASWYHLKAYGITHILQVGGELKPSHERRLHYLRLAVTDLETENLIANFERAFAFIDQARSKGGAVLVHCAQGVSRSATLVAGYLMWRERLGCDAAVAVVRATRPIADPNDGFVLQLREFEASACNLAEWSGWGHAALERALRRSSSSGRRVVHTYSDVIRRFHCHSLTEDDTVFCENDTILEL